MNRVEPVATIHAHGFGDIDVVDAEPRGSRRISLVTYDYKTNPRSKAYDLEIILYPALLSASNWVEQVKSGRQSDMNTAFYRRSDGSTGSWFNRIPMRRQSREGDTRHTAADNFQHAIRQVFDKIVAVPEVRAWHMEHLRSIRVRDQAWIEDRQRQLDVINAAIREYEGG